MILLCLPWLSNIYLLLLILDNWNNTTEKNEYNIIYYASEGMLTNFPQKDEAVVREWVDDESSSDINDKGLC